jgi:hypothetical protein
VNQARAPNKFEWHIPRLSGQFRKMRKVRQPQCIQNKGRKITADARTKLIGRESLHPLRKIASRVRSTPVYGFPPSLLPSFRPSILPTLRSTAFINDSKRNLILYDNPHRGEIFITTFFFLPPYVLRPRTFFYLAFIAHYSPRLHSLIQINNYFAPLGVFLQAQLPFL